MIQPERIQQLNCVPRPAGKYVLYWMQQAQRMEFNHALEHAVREANAGGLPVVVGFGLTPAFPNAQSDHYRFMLDGLREVQGALAALDIQFVVRMGTPDMVALDLAAEASLIVTDRGYLRIQKQWRERVARAAVCPLVQVESDVLVPVETVTGKEEYSAATLRRRLARVLDEYLVPVSGTRPVSSSMALPLESLDLSDTNAVLTQLGLAAPNTTHAMVPGGTTAAKERLQTFLDRQLERYADQRSDPSEDLGSGMSPYLHFGQISPLFIALRVHAARQVAETSRDAYLEELIVRRELAMNFVHYNPCYGSYDALPEWSRKTLSEHRSDPRPYVYGCSQLEQAETHDPYWNAAQLEMLLTGKMHGYMRMYWGKKIIEWSPCPEQAFGAALYLNNAFELDGRDPNGFAGVAWCFGKHDRGWPERPIFGKVRYMNANGLRRKFRMADYLERIRELVAQAGMPTAALADPQL